MKDIKSISGVEAVVHTTVTNFKGLEETFIVIVPFDADTPVMVQKQVESKNKDLKRYKKIITKFCNTMEATENQLKDWNATVDFIEQVIG